MLPKQFQNLTKYFTKFPGIGSRQATRFVFHLLRQPNDQFQNFLIELANLKNNVKICPNCYFIYDKNGGDNKACYICSDPARDEKTICIVEKEVDALAIEKTGHFKGTYHILGGNIYSFQNVDAEDFLMKNLKNRLDKIISITTNPEEIEIIMALNPTPDGEATASFIERELKNLNIKTSRLARGLQRGADLEYADEDTLKHAIKNRS